MGNENFTAAPSGTFATGAGPLNIAANEQKQYEALCDLVGRSDLKTDPRFAERQARKTNRFALKKELETALKSRSAKQWEVLCNEAGVPSGSVLTVPEILKTPQITGRRFVETLQAALPGDEPLRVTRPGFRLDVDYPEPTPPPVLGQDTERWLRALGYTREQIAALRERGVVTFANQPTIKESQKLPELKVRAETSSS